MSYLSPGDPSEAAENAEYAAHEGGFEPEEDFKDEYAEHTESSDYDAEGVEYEESDEDVEHDEDEEYTEHEVCPECEEYAEYEESGHAENDNHGSLEEDTPPGEPQFGWYKIRNEEEANIERLLRAPNDLPMVWRYETHTITRGEALKKLQPIVDKFNKSCGTASIMNDVRRIFTRRTIKVLPLHEKRILEINAASTGDTEIVEWLQEAKQDLLEHSWWEKHAMPRLTRQQADDMWRDLSHLAFHSPLYLTSRLDPRIVALKAVFEAQERRIQFLEQRLRKKNSAVRTEVEEIAGRLEIMMRSFPPDEDRDYK
ncbi:hypothetical protein V8C42DRAFT_362878 [Trichoderma barbatum]